MALALKQSTASQEIPLGYFLDSTNGNDEEIGLTIANTDIKIWKNGATALANKNSGGATHISNGIYYAVLDATDTDTVGPMVIFCHPTGALAVRVECHVYEEAIYDALFGAGAAGFNASGRVDVGSWLGTAVASPATAGIPSVDVVNWANNAVTASAGNPDVNVESIDDIAAPTTWRANINAELVDVLTVDTLAEIAQGTPPTSPTIAQALMTLFMATVRKIDVTSNTLEFHNAAGVVIFKKALPDDGTTYSEASAVSGP